MIAAGVTEPTNTEWASPVLLALKKDDTIRFCIYYRNLNLVTVRNAYLIAHMADCIDSLCDASIFTT